MLFKTLFFFLEILKKVGTAKPKMALLHCTAKVQSLGSLCTGASAKCKMQNAAAPKCTGQALQGTGRGQPACAKGQELIALNQ